MGTVKKWLSLLLLTMAAWSLVVAATAADRFDAALRHSGRSADDLRRDRRDHPAEILRLTGIGPGMQVADLLGGDGYYSELASYLVQPGGGVQLINNEAYDHWSDGPRRQRLSAGRLSNVTHRIVDLNSMQLGTGTFDAIILSKVYHDLYWIDPDGQWPLIHTGAVLDRVVAALKRGGVLLLIDHSALAGHGASDASTLHRIEEAYARRDFETRGLAVSAHSDLLRRPDDSLDDVSYKSPRLGNTDRFVLVFRKN
jgi:predicted methyltransferase